MPIPMNSPPASKGAAPSVLRLLMNRATPEAMMAMIIDSAVVPKS